MSTLTIITIILNILVAAFCGFVAYQVIKTCRKYGWNTFSYVSIVAMLLLMVLNILCVVTRFI